MEFVSRGLSNSSSSSHRWARIVELADFVDAWLFVLGGGWHFGLAAAGWHSLQLTEAGWRWLELAGVGIRLGSAITRSSPFEALTFPYRRSPCTGLQV